MTSDQPATSNLSAQSCIPCQGGIAPFGQKEIAALMPELDTAWTVTNDGTALMRRLQFKGFAKAVYHANLAAFLADQEGHHPDIAFGFGYCQVVFTTHEANGLTQNDFICAAKFDQAIAIAR